MMYRLLMIGLLLCFFLQGGLTAEAENNKLNMAISVDVPLDGIYKNGKMVRFYVTMKNQDQPFTGEMVVQSVEMGHTQILSQPKQFQIETDEQKTVEIDVHSDQLMNAWRHVGISILQGGEELEWIPVTGLQPQHEWVIGVISRDSNAFHFLSMAHPEQGRNLTIKQIKPSSLPKESILMNHLDVLAIGDLAEGLEKEQSEAIKEWVLSGGVLVVSGGRSYESTVKYLGDILPYSSEETQTRKISQDIEMLSEMKPPVDQVSVLKEATETFHAVSFGKGTILTVAYDVTEEPIASWQGNKALWQQVMKRWLLDSVTRKDMRAISDYGLMELSYMTPGVTPPHFPLISSIWIVYILIVTPGLFLLLKRRGKREWAWFLIPSLSIFLTAGIYGLGKYMVAKDDVVHTVSAIDILHDQQAEVNSATSFLMIDGGTFTVEQVEGATLIPNHRGRTESTESVITFENGSFQFRKIPYLSMKEAYAHSLRKDVGYIENKLYIDEERVKGKVRNLTVFDLKNVLVTVGMQEIHLGDLPRGKDIEVDVSLKRVYVPDSILLDREEEGRVLNRHERMERLQRSHYEYNATSIPVTITGWSEEGIEVFNVVDREEKKYYSTIVRQNTTLIASSNGKQIYPYGTLPLRIGETKGNWEGVQGGYYVSNGFLNFALKVQPNGLMVDRIEVPLNETPYKPFEKKIYNVKKDRWDTVESNQPIILTGTEKEEYITPQGEIVLRFYQESEERVFLPQPFFLVEGQVIKP
ncbi:hypothetical protein [Ammoniphilus sp. CFH 90114]|uniref:hypothetical protein n=1 Tax=Ammoniphilus sp. CFH 90114 TaxID=2493665 RepID=UPI00100E1667|nr:hypothetical protein [Ammoniphilus sp. CFH 90114]RXT13525.1 hypothetical protein EIZ39_05065 [Ammoniphilus sp. CFH 90114]